MAAQHHSLDRSLMRGLAWTGGVRWLTQALSWGITIVVARTLTPADYGLMGMATVYVGFAQLLSDAGLSAAVINRSEADPDVWAGLGGLAVLLGACCCAVSLVGADVIARFYGRPEVATVIRVLSVLFLARGLQMLPRGLLARELDFRRLAWIEGIEAVVLSAVTLSFALAGSGYWALVSGVVASGLTGTLLSCHWRSHRIRWPNDPRRMRGDLAIGFHILGSQLAWYTYSNSDFAVVGRVLGSGALGAYSLAWTIASIPVERVSALVGRVTPAFFATVQRDSEALRRYLHRLTEGISLLTVPTSIGLALVAPTFVAVLLGPRWIGVVAPLRFLALYAAFRSVATLAPQVLVAAGRARENMNFSILAALILPGVFYVGARWGTTGVALGWMVAYPLLASLLFRSVFQTIRMPVARYLDALHPSLVATALMTVAVLGVQLLVPGARYPFLSLIVQVVVGAVVCIATVLAWYPDRVAAFRHALHLSGLWRYSVPAPLFATADRPERPRLLLISPHFPPDQATGALRWQKFSRFAVDRGWGLDVIALHPEDLPAPDPRRLADLPPGVRIYGVRAPTLWADRVERGVAALLRRVRRVGRPAGPSADARGPATVESRGRSEGERWRIRGVRDLARAYFAWNTHLHDGLWARAAAGVAHRVIDVDLHRAVISCGPPHNAHEAGRLVAAGTDLPLVMDLRDPWSQVQRLPEAIASPVWWAFARRDERRAIARASLIVGNSEPLRDALRTAYPAASERIVTVTNGFDDDPLPPARPGRRFTIAYAGAIYLDRDPRPLFRAVAQVVRDTGVGSDGLAIELMGSVDSFEGRSLEAIAEEEGVRPYLHLRPLAPRSEALEFLSRAHMLVILPQDSDLAIPAKVFDYVRYPAWILALVGTGSATGRLLRGTGADVVAPDDPDAIAAVVCARLRQHQGGERPGPLKGLARLARRTQATVLFDAIERITGPLTRESGTLLEARTRVEVPA